MNISKFSKVRSHVKGFAQKVRPKLLTMYNKTKELAKDTVEFASKNPKKLAKVGGAALAVGLLVTGFVKMVKSLKNKNEQNQIMAQIVNHQREHINELKEHIANQDEIIAVKGSVLDVTKK